LAFCRWTDRAGVTAPVGLSKPRRVAFFLPYFRTVQTESLLSAVVLKNDYDKICSSKVGILADRHVLAAQQFWPERKGALRRLFVRDAHPWFLSKFKIGPFAPL
jgi:hypothetical protein